MRVVLVSPDLLIASRIAGIVESAGGLFHRADDPALLGDPGEIALLLVDWAYRDAGWSEQLRAWAANATPASSARLIVFGPHTDLEAHAAARSAGVGPMWARSRLLSALPGILSNTVRRLDPEW